MESRTTDYPLHVKSSVDKILTDFTSGETKEFIRNFQYVTKRFLIDFSARGLLIFHSPGYGKSITGAAIIDHYRKYDKKRKVIIMAAKSLQSNFENNIRKYMKMNPHNDSYEKSSEFITNAISNIKFVSLNASNMYTQISNVNKSEAELEFEKSIAEFTTNTGFLENSILVVDEVHNFSNSVANQSKNAISLYQAIMNTKNIKLVFMTGTPIINTPFELVPLFNMLRGYISVGKQLFTLFPENRDDFDAFFVNGEKIKNKGKFQNRIYGLVSYYGDAFFDKKDKQDFPEEKPLIVERVPMSLHQYGRYLEARELEQKEELRKKQRSVKSDYFTAKDSSGPQSSYNIRSRQISNYYIPEYALTFTKSDRSAVVKHIKKIKVEDLKNLAKFSPKFAKIIFNIKKYKGQLGVVYSEFVSGEGLGIFTLVLNQYGFEPWEHKVAADGGYDIEFEDWDGYAPDSALDKSSDMTGGTSTSMRYALVTGDVPMLERQNILNVFNNDDNITGKNIALLLISKSGAEGLNLKNVRHLHVMEPFWNYARVEQVIARGVRFQSHLKLPVAQRNVQPYLYVSTYPVGIPKKEIKEQTTDEKLLFSALKGKKLRSEFELAIIEASIDCSVHHDGLEKKIQETIKCRVCVPNGVRLYEPNLYLDMKYSDPCVETTKSEIKVKEVKIDINGVPETFYYSDKDGKVKVYTFSDKFNMYVPLNKEHPAYAEIVRSLV